MGSSVIVRARIPAELKEKIDEAANVLYEAGLIEEANQSAVIRYALKSLSYTIENIDIMLKLNNLAKELHKLGYISAPTPSAAMRFAVALLEEFVNKAKEKEEEEGEEDVSSPAGAS